MTRSIILASTSPRRLALLKEDGWEVQCIAPDPSAEENAEQTAEPVQLVQALAIAKAADVAARVARGIVVGADTVAECDGQILGKPRDRDDARRMLWHLRGRRHLVHTGVCLWKMPESRRLDAVATTELIMDPLTDEQIEHYLDSGQWEGKAGAFGYQDGPDWLHIVHGSASNVVGLPLDLVRHLYEQLVQLKPTEPKTEY